MEIQQSPVTTKHVINGITGCFLSSMIVMLVMIVLVMMIHVYACFDGNRYTKHQLSNQSVV